MVATGLSLTALTACVVVLLIMNSAARRWKAAVQARISTGRMVARLVEAALEHDEPEMRAAALPSIHGVLRAGFGYDEGEDPWET